MADEIGADPQTPDTTEVKAEDLFEDDDASGESPDAPPADPDDSPLPPDPDKANVDKKVERLGYDVSNVAKSVDTLSQQVQTLIETGGVSQQPGESGRSPGEAGTTELGLEELDELEDDDSAPVSAVKKLAEQNKELRKELDGLTQQKKAVAAAAEAAQEHEASFATKYADLAKVDGVYDGLVNRSWATAGRSGLTGEALKGAATMEFNRLASAAELKRQATGKDPTRKPSTSKPSTDGTKITTDGASANAADKPGDPDRPNKVKESDVWDDD